MLGTKLTKPLSVEDDAKYTEYAEWCNANGCRIDDKGDYYEVVQNVASGIDEIPSLEQRINDFELALMELAGE